MPDYIEQLRGRLLKLGCPITHIRRLEREVADHREDLKQAGLTEGLSETDADARANTLLGDPVYLAEQMMKNIRRSSWWGRHRVVTFVLLPLFAYPVLWTLLTLSVHLLIFKLGYDLDRKKIAAAVNNPIVFHHIFLGFQLADYLAVVLSTLLFCWLARRAAVKFKWMFIAAVICSLLFGGSYAHVKPTANGYTVTLGAIVNPALAYVRGTIPLVIVGAACFFQWRAVRRFQQKMTHCG